MFIIAKIMEDNTMEDKLTLKIITEAYYKQASTLGPPSLSFSLPALGNDCDSVE